MQRINAQNEWRLTKLGGNLLDEFMPSLYIISIESTLNSLEQIYTKSKQIFSFAVGLLSIQKQMNISMN